MWKGFVAVAAVAFASNRLLQSQSAQQQAEQQAEQQQQQSASTSPPLMQGCPVAQRPTSSASSSSSPALVVHPLPHHQQPLGGGCPVAQRPSSSSSSASSSRSEPPDSGPHLASSASPFSSLPPLDAGLLAEGEETPDGSIPAAGRGNSSDGSTWVNPSPNALFRALKRKGKGIAGEDAVDVSSVHNAVTDWSWQCVMEYERLHAASCPRPSLARFYGMDGVWSVKARVVHNVLGGPLPFDRHDWIVDRCGKEVRYIIDYYSVEQLNDDGETDISYSIDARPAPTLTGLYDRGRMAWKKYSAGEQWW